jgi:hypothetical protein
MQEDDEQQGLRPHGKCEVEGGATPWSGRPAIDPSVDGRSPSDLAMRPQIERQNHLNLSNWARGLVLQMPQIELPPAVNAGPAKRQIKLPPNVGGISYHG